MKRRFEPNQRVEHTIFGLGTVVEFRPHAGDPDNGFLVVRFDDQGTKELVTSFAGDRLKVLPVPTPP